jgi:hypothetical protein
MIDVRELALLQVALAAAPSAWLLLGRPAGALELALRVAASWLLFVGVAFAGLWLALPVSAIAVLGLILLAATVVASARTRPVQPGRARQAALWVSRLLGCAFAMLGAWAAVPALQGREKPAETVDLAFPFQRGLYIVGNGGAAGRINGHYMTLQPPFARWRGESYAVDLLKVDRLGFRTRTRTPLALPRDPSAYLIFGETVRAPCNGTVVSVARDRPDMPVPQRDRQHLEGNFVLMRCGGHFVFLGHFRRGSIAVEPGAEVSVGAPLGQVGNSGNTDEPHLHLHVQTPGPTGAPLSGRPVHVTFGGRFLARNMIVAGAE